MPSLASGSFEGAQRWRNCMPFALRAKGPSKIRSHSAELGTIYGVSVGVLETRFRVIGLEGP